MSSPLSVKRRKVENASRTLKKPFISPMRNANTERRPLKDSTNTANQPYIPSTLAHTISANNPPLPKTPGPSRVSQHSMGRSTPIRKTPAFSTTSKRADPAELAAQKALTSIELQIKALRNDLDTLNQANGIIDSSTDAELEALTEKWRLASHSAAEELFGQVKERVCRMGGVAAWRESEKKKYDRAHGLGDFVPEPEESDDADCEFDSQGEELPEEEQEFRKREKRRVKREAMEAADLPSTEEVKGTEVGREGGQKLAWEEPANDDDSFTMDMMLRSLNIDLKVIGYDKIAQRWE